ncbi:MAG: response regulator [Deltaproteobacteria bacterium]|nr:response regulator [Deltaproteobacteria bacterium]
MILLVDDNPMVTTVVSEMLGVLGHKVTVACNGQEAIQTYGVLGHNIDIVILDVNMPGMDGIETYENLKKMNPEIKVLAISGFCEEDKVEKILGSGFHGFLQKPFEISDLSEMLKSIVET